MDSMDNLGIPIGQYAVFRTSGSSGEPAVVVIPSSVLEFIFGLFLARLSKSQLMIWKKFKRQILILLLREDMGILLALDLISFCNI